MTNIFSSSTKSRRSREHSEIRFRWFGKFAIGISLAFLFVMVGSILLKGKSAFVSSDIAITIDLGPDNVDKNNINETRFDALVKKSLRQTFPNVKSRKEKKKLPPIKKKFKNYLFQQASIFIRFLKFSYKLHKYKEIYLSFYYFCCFLNTSWCKVKS